MNIRKKLKSRAGFTLAETLLAVAILMLVSVIVATGIPVARKAYEKVVLSSNAETMLTTAISSLRNELGTAAEIKLDDSNEYCWNTRRRPPRTPCWGPPRTNNRRRPATWCSNPTGTPWAS